MKIAARRGRNAKPERFLATIMFTDIAGSTEKTVELGDHQWRRLLDRHNLIVRRELKRFGGRELDTAGDGFFAIFDQPANGIRCATAITEQVHALGIDIRAGLHLGEVEVMGEKVGGIAVNIGARVASKAQAGEVLISSTMRDLVAGSDLRFIERGEHDLKGVPGTWRLYALDLYRSEETPVLFPGEITEKPRPHWQRVSTLTIAAAVVIAVAVSVVAFTRSSGAAAKLPPGENTVGVIDTRAGKFVAAVKVGERPQAIAASGGDVWALNFSDQTVSRIDAGTRTVTRTLSVGGAPTGIAIGGGSVWITTGFGQNGGASGSLLRFNISDNTLSASIPIGDGADGVVFGGNYVWVTNEVTDSVARVDPQTNSFVNIAVGPHPQSIAFGAGAVWVANTLSDSVSRIDAITNRVTPISLRFAPSGIAVTADAVWVTSTQGNALIRLDPRTNGIVTTISIGGGPKGVTTSADGVWVTTERTRMIVRIDPGTNKVDRLLHINGMPDDVVAGSPGIWVTVHGT